MSDLLAIGSSALLAYRKALDNTGHNIANVNTEGYSRQRVTLQAQGGVAAGNGFAGNGVSAITTQRIHDQFIQTRLLGDASGLGRLDTLSAHSNRLDALLSDSDTGLAQPLQQFFTALSALTANPSDIAARQTVLAQAQSLTSRFQDLHGRISAQGSEIEQRLTQVTGEINQYASTIAQLNQRIALEQGKAGGQPPNDLLDQRDQAVQALAERVGITTRTEIDGSISIFTGSGQSLVQGQTTYPLGTRSDVWSSGELEITHGSGAGAVVITGQLSGGTLGGLLDTRRELITPTLNQLGLVASGLTQVINQQHQLGNDLDGAAGGNFFRPVAGTVLPATSNTGTASVSVGLTNAAQLSGEDYVLEFNGSWQLTQRNGTSIALSGSGTALDPFTAEGLSITISGAPATGDRYLLQPTRNAAGDVATAITSVRQIAAASGTALANSSDNTNARALAALASQPLLRQGTQTLNTANNALVSGVGMKAQSAALGREAAAAVMTQTLAEESSVSGVNLDEEAADLLRYQQAYQASAQVIATANTVFEALLSAARR